MSCEATSGNALTDCVRVAVELSYQRLLYGSLIIIILAAQRQRTLMIFWIRFLLWDFPRGVYAANTVSQKCVVIFHGHRLQLSSMNEQADPKMRSVEPFIANIQTYTHNKLVKRHKSKRKNQTQQSCLWSLHFAPSAVYIQAWAVVPIFLTTCVHASGWCEQFRDFFYCY